MIKRLSPLLLALLLAACGTAPAASPAHSTVITVFAAASLTETMDQAIAEYQRQTPGVTVVPTYDSSGTLQTQIQEGAACDLFLSAAPEQMDALESDGLLDTSTRVDLLENQVVLAVPEGNPAGIESFPQLMERLQNGDVLLAVGGAGVPVGQYTRRLFDFYGLREDDIAACLSYGSNVKEVTAQVSEAAADCGVVYATDAYSAGLAVVDAASPEQCGRVVYPAAVLRRSGCPAEAAAFLAYLQTPEVSEIFSSVGFTPLQST